MSVSAHVDASDTLPTLQRVPIETPRLVVASRARDNSSCCAHDGSRRSPRVWSRRRDHSVQRGKCVHSGAPARVPSALEHVHARGSLCETFVSCTALRRMAVHACDPRHVRARGDRLDERERAGVTRRGERGCLTRGTPWVHLTRSCVARIVAPAVPQEPLRWSRNAARCGARFSRGHAA